jgi:hypothetical protein
VNGFTGSMIGDDAIDSQVGQEAGFFIGTRVGWDYDYYWGCEARFSAANQDLVYAKEVLLVKDVSETDQFDRLLRYVFVNGIFVNQKLVSEGYAVAATYPPDVACADEFVSAQGRARAAWVGLWQPTSTPRPTSVSSGGVGVGGNCDPSYPDVCLQDGIGDYDCAGGSGNGPNYVSGPIRVLPPDPFGLDGNNDGYGCQ